MYRSLFRKSSVYGVVFLLGTLLLGDIFFTRFNNSIIVKNRELQREAETIKLYIEQIGKSTIHGLDLGLRGYALNRHPQFFTPVDSALLRKDSILHNVEFRLQKQGYDMTEYYRLKDSLNAYSNFILRLKELLDAGNHAEFNRQFGKDKGLDLWIQYTQCQRHISEFEDLINAKAQANYESAIQRNYIIQLLLFIIGFPVLFLSAYYTNRTFKLSELLRRAESEKNKILLNQNEQLEKMVADRTQEIATQNEEIISQNELLMRQREEIESQRNVLKEKNERLHNAHAVIERKNREISLKNDSLVNEIKLATEELRQANRELIEHNSQLEQFAFIAAHNLRAPVATILGLANLIDLAESDAEKNDTLGKLVAATKDMDNVIRDLNKILEIKKHQENITDVDLQVTLDRVLEILKREINETNTKITANFSEAKMVSGVIPYVESILYNLIGNAIKYRNPDRSPAITMRTTLQDSYVCLTVTDNGLGIDLEKFRSNMFSLYKRFHLHMEGKGLGLYLVRTQIEAMGGKIDVESELDKGSTFYVYFRKIKPLKDNLV